MANFKGHKSSFYKDLVRGQDAEAKFLDKYGAGLEPFDERRADFKIKGSSFLVELKSDYYSHEKYDNFIMERYSHDKVDGGPWRAYRQKVKYFVYWFVTEDVLYIFESVRLLARVKKMVKKHNLKLYKRENIKHTTQYYKVKREWFVDIMLEQDALRERKYKNSKK